MSDKPVWSEDDLRDMAASFASLFILESLIAYKGYGLGTEYHEHLAIYFKKVLGDVTRCPFVAHAFTEYGNDIEHALTYPLEDLLLLTNTSSIFARSIVMWRFSHDR